MDFRDARRGILPPNVLRWYWWRLNGQGYAAGVFGGMALSLGQVFLEQAEIIPPLPLYVGFPVIAIISTIITIVVSLLTQPTDLETLKNFYRKVQPAGAWQPAKEAVLQETPDFRKQSPFSRDLLNTVVAMIGITALYVSMLYLILHRLTVGFSLLGTTLVTVIILYFTWYKNLPPPSAQSSEEAENLAEERDEMPHAEAV
jgi:SSS family solute:Na+ symporter